MTEFDIIGVEPAGSATRAGWLVLDQEARYSAEKK
jgi:hypothetical protein